MTMHKLTGGRFTLGLGRGVKPLFDAIVWPRHHRELEDFAGLMRRLWNGETIVDDERAGGEVSGAHADRRHECEISARG